MYKSTPQNPKRKPFSVKASRRSATPTAETLTPQKPRKFEANAPQKTKERRRKLEDWLKGDLLKMIEQRRYYVRYLLKGRDREDFEAVLKRLRFADRDIDRAIDLVNFIDRGSVTIWFWVKGGK
jgi:hypothetical protein